MTKEEAYNKVEQTISDYFGFLSLVKKMREAQEVEAMLSWEEDEEFVSKVCIEARNAEREVDEYLKKMEV